MSLQTHSHRRKNLLTGEWVLVSPHRTRRPWKGQVDQPEPEEQMTFDPQCYLCPGNERAGGLMNPKYSGPYSFDNDFSALSPDSSIGVHNDPLLEAQAESGCCRVVCYSEQHDLRLADMDREDVKQALAFIVDQFNELDAMQDIGYVQVFENRGQMMGCSNPHPHAQIWATSGTPVEAGKESRSQASYFESNGSSLLKDYLEKELSIGERIVCKNDHAVSLVPFWAVWPYETLLIPRRSMAGPEEMASEELSAFGDILQQTLRACEKLFQAAVPYSMGFHPRPSDGKPHPEWQFHAHIYPPLLRSASVRKHLVGYEMLAMPQRDFTPETAAQRLRDNC